MGTLRMTAEAKRILGQAEGATDAREAMRIIATLAGQPVFQEECVKSYDSKTGKPTEHEWNLYKVWDGIIPWDWSLFRASIYKEMMALIPDDQVIIVEGNDRRVVISKTQAYSDSGPGGGSMPSYLQFRIATPL